MKWRWLGNVVMGEDSSPIPSYLKVKTLGFEIMKQSILKTQMYRSGQLVEINRTQISGKTKWEKEQMQHVIEKINLRIENSQKFILAVRKVLDNKELILEDRPSYFASVPKSNEEIEEKKQINV